MRKLVVGLLFKGRVDGSISSATSTVAKRHRALEKEVSGLQRRLGANRDARKYAAVLNKLERRSDKLGGESDQLQRRIARVRDRYEEARRAARLYAGETDKVTNATERASRATRRKSRFDRMDRADMAKGAAVVGFAAASIATRAAMKEQERTRRLQTVINPESGDKRAAAQKSRMAARAFAQRSDTVVTADELLDMEYDFNSAGLDDISSRAGARIAHKVSKVTRGDATTVAKTLATTYNLIGDKLIGDEEQRMRTIGNVLTAAQNQYQFGDFSDLQSGLIKALPQAKSLNVSLEQTATIIGQLNNAGIAREEAGTAFSALTRSLYDATQELDIQMARDARTGELDLIKTLGRLEEALSDLDIDERGQIIQKLFGDEGKRGLLPLLDNIDKLGSGLDDLNAKVLGSILDRDYTSITSTDIEKVKQLTQSVGNLASGLGRGFSPVVGRTASGLSRMINGLSGVIDRAPIVGAMIGTLTAGGVALLGVVGSLATAQWAWNFAMDQSSARWFVGTVGRLDKSLLTLSTRGLPAAIMGTRALGVAMLTNPLTWVVGGLVVGALLIRKYWGPIGSFFKGLWEEVGPPIRTVYDTLSRMPVVGRALKFVFAPLTLAWQGAKTLAGWLFKVEEGSDGAYSAGQRLGRMLKTGFSNSAVGKTVRSFTLAVVTLDRAVDDLIGRFERIYGVLERVSTYTNASTRGAQIRAGIATVNARSSIAPINPSSAFTVASALARAKFAPANDREANDNAITAPEQVVARLAANGGRGGPHVTQHNDMRSELHFHGVTDKEGFVADIAPVLDRMHSEALRRANHDID